MKDQGKLIENPVEIQNKFQRNINGNQFSIPVQIPKKHKWKSIANLVKISMKNNLKFQ